MDIDLPRLRALSDLAPFDSHHIILHRMHACTLLPLCPAPCSASNLLPAHPRLDVHVQVSNTHDWHGTRKLARANEQQKLQQQQKAKQRQQQQKQAKKRQQQQNGGETRVSTLALNPSGARSADNAKVIYSLGTRRGHSPTLTSHGHRFDSELNRLEAEAARRKERLEHKKQRKRKRDRSAHNRRTNERKNRRRSEDRKARAQARSQMAHVQARFAVFLGLGMNRELGGPYTNPIGMTHAPVSHAPFLSHRCKWSSRRARRS